MVGHLPDVRVEIAFDSGVLTPAASRTWTDVSEWVELGRGIQIQRGRSDEFTTTSPSTLTLTFDNRDGRFTPGRAASPYYPNVKIGRPIRVTVDPDGDASVRFTGYVDEWPVEWPGSDSAAFVTVSATSRLARLGEGAELLPVVMTEILADNPTAYYPLTEPEGARFAQEYTGSDHIGMYSYFGGGGITFGTGEGVPTDGLPAPSINSRLSGQEIQFGAWYLNHDHSAQDFTMEAFVRIVPGEGASFTNGDLVRVLELFRGDGWLVNDYTRLQLRAFVGTDGKGFLACQVEEQVAGDWNITLASASGSGLDYIDLWQGTMYHLALSYHHHATAPTLKFYVNGELMMTSNSVILGDGTYETPMPNDWLIWAGDTVATAGTSKTELSHLAIYNTILPDDRIEAHALAGLDGFSTEYAGERITRIAGYGDVPAAEINTDTGTIPISHIDTAGNTVANILRTIETTESGILYDAPDGTLRFRDRDHRYGSSAAFTLDAAAQHLDASSVRPILDRTSLINSATAKNLDGDLEARYEDATSIEDYGHHRRDLELATTDVDQLQQAAAWRVNRYKDPRPRFTSLAPVDVLPLIDSLRDAIRDADISTRFAVTNLPSQAPDDVSEFFIEGVTETIGLESWMFSFNASPAAVVDGLFTVDSSELDSTDVLAY